MDIEVVDDKEKEQMDKRKYWMEDRKEELEDRNALEGHEEPSMNLEMELLVDQRSYHGELLLLFLVLQGIHPCATID